MGKPESGPDNQEECQAHEERALLLQTLAQIQLRQDEREVSAVTAGYLLIGRSADRIAGTDYETATVPAKKIFGNGFI